MTIDISSREISTLYIFVFITVLSVMLLTFLFNHSTTDRLGKTYNIGCYREVAVVERSTIYVIK